MKAKEKKDAFKKKIRNGMILCCSFLMFIACLSACGSSTTPTTPETMETIMPTSQNQTILDRGQQYVSDLGLSISIDDYAYSNDGNMSILISGTVKNTSDQEISLKDVMSVSVIQKDLVCEGMPREDVGLTKGIGFQDTISAGAEERLMDVVCTIEAMEPIQVKIIFADGNEVIWNL